MFAVAAAVFFLLAAFHVALGTVDLLMLGLACLALHFGVGPLVVWPRRD